MPFAVPLTVFAIIAGVLAPGLTRDARAQERYPSRPIDFVVTWGAGGGADAMARTIGRHLEPTLGVGIPVTNIPGASDTTGLNHLVAAKADGYTIATYTMDTLATIPMSLSKFMVDDFEWIARTQMADSFFFVKTDSPYKTVQDLLRAAKQNPGKIRVAVTGYGYVSTLSGHSEVLYEQAGDIAQYLKAGQLRPLIIFTDKRHPAFPDVPASLELGYDIQLPQFRGIVAKQGTPPDRVKILAEAIRQAMETPAYKRLAEERYFRPESYMGPAEFGRWVREQVTLLDRYVKEFGLKR